MSEDRPVTLQEFRHTLLSLCLKGGTGLPRKLRPRHIFLRAAAQALEDASPCSEKTLNRVLEGWINTVAPETGLDHVGLRRTLVDYGYVVRDREGREYRVRLDGRGEIPFSREVAEVDAVELVQQGRDRVERRKRNWLSRQE